MGAYAHENEVITVRHRSIAALSAAALSMLVLAGCAGDAEPTADADPSADATEAPADLCDSAAPGGDDIDAVKVSGEFGEEAEVSFDAPLELTEIERKVLTEGSGDKLEAGEYITYAATVYDAETGEYVGSEGYDDQTALPAGVQANNIFGMALGCATPGTRVAFTFPGQTAQDGTTMSSQVYVLDFLARAETKARGEAQDAPEGVPGVELSEDGEPTVTIPDDLEVPKETEVTTLIEGDGETVAEGDSVFLQYKGVKASDGEEFDSSWSRGTPTALPATAGPGGVVEGFAKAMIGQKVGSQVIAVIPRAEGYGPTEGHELQEEDLIFVVDILGAMHTAE
ncbi:MAG: FKBP-type peptidyl-prolyl cis-trans isomerase [Microbacterium gubbeenense]